MVKHAQFWQQTEPEFSTIFIYKVVMTPAVRNLCSKRFSSVFTYNILHVKDSAACVSFVLKGSVQFPLISYKLKR